MVVGSTRTPASGSLADVLDQSFLPGAIVCATPGPPVPAVLGTRVSSVDICLT